VSDHLAALLLSGAAGFPTAVGALAGVRVRSSLAHSITFGAAAGATLGAVAFDLLPRAARLTSLWLVAAAAAAGLAVVYGYDLVMHAGVTAGPKAEQRERAETLHRRHGRGRGLAVLGGSLMVMRLAHGAVLGLAAGGTGVALATAFGTSNLNDGFNLGQLGLADRRSGAALGIWVSATIIALMGGAAASAWWLTGTAAWIRASVAAFGAGTLIYVSSAHLISEAHAHEFARSSTLALFGAFIAIFWLS
jgi:zinc transporter ZupT